MIVTLGHSEPHRDAFPQALERGKRYRVYGMTMFVAEGLRIYIHANPKVWFPSPFSVSLFEIVDPAIPHDWSARIGMVAGRPEISFLGFSQWANDLMFYEKLVSGDEASCRLYAKMREGID